MKHYIVWSNHDGRYIDELPNEEAMLTRLAELHALPAHQPVASEMRLTLAGDNTPQYGYGFSIDAIIKGDLVSVRPVSVAVKFSVVNNR